MKALTCEVGEASATLVGHPKSIIENKMENIDCWERNKQISIEVDRMFAESDKAVFEILHKIAALAINNALSSSETEKVIIKSDGQKVNTQQTKTGLQAT